MATRTTTIEAYNVTEAARLVGVSRWTLHRAIVAGELQATEIGKRGKIIYAADLLDWLISRGKVG